jgi:hypothetical protein
LSKLAETSNAKNGGLFTGKSHAEGGIPAIVTDTGQPIEVEGGEAIITKKATAMFCEELSEINQAGGGVPIPCPTDVDKIMDKFERGGITTQKEKKQVYDKWKSLVNMTQTELKNYQKSKDGKSSGLSKSDADNLNISSGRESAEWILKMKQLNYKSWTSTMWKWANKQISFISRMRGVKGAYFDEDNNRTPKLKALLIWGHNPAKFKDGGSVENIKTPPAKFRILRANNRIKYAGTDNPSWLTLEQAQKLVDYSSGEMIYQFDETGEKLYEVFKGGGLTAEKMLENPLTIKYLKDLDDGEGWWVNTFHAKTKNYLPNTYYHLNTSGNNAGVGKGLYLGRDKNALISFYGIQDEIENDFDTHLLDTYLGNPNWLDLINYDDYEKIKQEGLDKYELPINLKGLEELDEVGELMKKLAMEKGYDGIRYYDPNATGEEFVLFNIEKLKKIPNTYPEKIATGKLISKEKMEDDKITFSKDALKVVPTHQLKYLKSTDFSEMEDAITQINEAVFSVPKLYGSASIQDKMIYLHYFNGNQDWHIVEYDRNSGEAYGYANLGYGAELGYMSIPEIVDSTVQLDFYFEPTLWSELNEDEDSAFEKQNSASTESLEREEFVFDPPNEHATKLKEELRKLNYQILPAPAFRYNTIVLKGEWGKHIFEFELFDNYNEFKFSVLSPLDFKEVVEHSAFGFSPAYTMSNDKLLPYGVIANNINDELREAMITYAMYKDEETQKQSISDMVDAIETPAPNKISLTDFANQMGIEVTHMDEPTPIGEVQTIIEPVQSIESNEISLDVKTYKNPYELNKSIEKWIDNNVGAIENVFKRTYSTEEKLFIRNYTGYGGLGKFGEITVGSMFEFFTPTKVIKTMWALAYKYGYSIEKSILETSVGTGEFLQFASPDTRKVAYEINKYSATITKILYPTTEVRLEPFEKMFIKDNYTIKGKLDNLEKFDMVIGNPPYGSFDVLDRKASRYLLGMGEKDYTNAHNYVEYFLRRSLDVLKPNGLIVMIVGAELKNGGTMFLDSKESPVKQFLNENAILLDAYRLPDSTFERTGVTTDILVIQKK